MNTHNLQAANLIWHPDINLAVKAPKPSEGWVNAAKEQALSALCLLMRLHRVIFSFDTVGACTVVGRCLMGILFKHDRTLRAEAHRKEACVPVGAICGPHDNDMSSGLEAIHEREKLRHDAALHLTLHSSTSQCLPHLWPPHTMARHMLDCSRLCVFDARHVSCGSAWLLSQDQHLCLLTLGRDGVDLIDENDGGRILLGLLKGPSADCSHSLRPACS